jgi:hypothetical protein
MNGSTTTPRAQPFYCPYCGEEDFVPGEGPGAYHCNSCDRYYAVKFLGVGASSAASGEPEMVPGS